jgi:hypothetical protein
MNRQELREVLGVDPHDDLSDTELLEAVLGNLLYRVDVNAPEGSGWTRESLYRLFSIKTDVLKVDGEYTPGILKDVEDATQDFMDVDVDVTAVLVSPNLRGHGEMILDVVDKRKFEQERQHRFDHAVRLWQMEFQYLEDLKSELKEDSYASRMKALERRKPVLEKS